MATTTTTTTTKETAGPGSTKEREGPGDDGQDSLEESLDVLSEQSSDSGRRPARAAKAEDFLRDFFTYEATKALLPVPVPLPFRIYNPRMSQSSPFFAILRHSSPFFASLEDWRRLAKIGIDWYFASLRQSTRLQKLAFFWF